MQNPTKSYSSCGWVRWEAYLLTQQSLLYIHGRHFENFGSKGSSSFPCASLRCGSVTWILRNQQGESVPGNGAFVKVTETELNWSKRTSLSSCPWIVPFHAPGAVRQTWRASQRCSHPQKTKQRTRMEPREKVNQGVDKSCKLFLIRAVNCRRKWTSDVRTVQPS